MNLAHVHLIINHVPIVGIPVALLFLGCGLWKQNKQLQNISLLVLVALAALVLPVYLTGEPAEKVIKHLPEVTEAFISPHEEAAKYALILTLTTGFFALVALWFRKDESKSRKLNIFVFILACVAVGALVRTGNLGGEIRHTELRSEAVAPAESK
jgi:uncharacterized membrane protein